MTREQAIPRDANTLHSSRPDSPDANLRSVGVQDDETLDDLSVTGLQVMFEVSDDTQQKQRRRQHGITLYSKFAARTCAEAWDFAGMTEWCVNVGVNHPFCSAIILVQYVADKAIAADDAEHKAKAESMRSLSWKKRGFRA